MVNKNTEILITNIFILLVLHFLRECIVSDKNHQFVLQKLLKNEQSI